jgi:hypothetical protein
LATYGGPVHIGNFDGPDDFDAAYAEAGQRYDHVIVEPDGYLCLSQVPPCERCKIAGPGVELEDSRTAYVRPRLDAWTRLLLDDELLGRPPDPNAPLWLCRDCAADHTEYWDEMWRDYYSSQGA